VLEIAHLFTQTESENQEVPYPLVADERNITTY